MTYRSNFSPIFNSTKYFTSDCGWGCMIRVSQMLLATTLNFVQQKVNKVDNSQGLVNDIVMLFFDHKLPIEQVKEIKEYGKIIGYMNFNKKVDKAEIIQEILEENKENEYEIIETSLSNSIKSSNSNNNIKPPQTTQNIVISNKSNSFTNISPKQLDNKNRHSKLNIKQDSIKKDNFSFIILDNDLNFNFNHTHINPPFSIQNICNIGMGPDYQRNPGEWFSDISCVQILKELSDDYLPDNYLKLLYFQDGYIDEAEIINECFEETICSCENTEAEQAGYEYIDKNITNLNYCESFAIEESRCKCFENSYIHNDMFYHVETPGLLLVSIRLGLDKIDPMYYDKVLDIFSIPGSVGFAGGKPNRALYFIGVWKTKGSERKLIYLDPHFNQEAAPNKKELEELYYLTYLPKDFYIVDVGKISPSLTCGFYFTNLKEYLMLINKLKEISEEKNSILKFGQSKIQKSYNVKDFESFSGGGDSYSADTYLEVGKDKVKLHKNFFN